MNYMRDNYTSAKNDVPILIDYGASTIKAGYATSQTPDVVIRSYINKFKDSNTQSNQIAQWDTDVFKNYRSPFEKNLIQHSGALEQLNDFVFERLQAGKHGRVNHPIILTECFATTDLARMIVLEQMFECYQVPNVMLGVDALFSVFQDDLEAYLKQTQLIVHLGDQTVHVVPIVNGQVIYSNIKRLNLGGLNSLKYFYQTIQLRHPHLKFTYPQIDYWHKQYTSVAIDYQLQLRYFQGPQQYYGYRDQISEQNRFHEDHLQFLDPIYIDIPIVQKIVSAEDLKRKDENRQRMKVRLQESIQQSRINKKSQLEQQLLALQQELEADLNNEELKKKITTLQVKLGLAPKEALDELKYNLLNVPDDKLTPSQLNQKRYQKVMYEQALMKKQKNQEFKQLQKDANKFKLEEPEKYLQMLYEKRDRIVLQIQERKKLQQEMNSRNSRFNQKRIQTLAYLGADDKAEDDFGKDDKDWEIYRSVTKEIDSADEKSKYKLQELEQELKDLDPDFEIKILKSIANIHQLGMNLSQVQLSVDRVRCQEIYFQPSLIGVEQQGLVDMIKLSSKGLDKLLLQNIILTGGGAKTQGIIQRLQKDLISEYDCPIAIKIASDPVFGTWLGMKNFANKHSNMLSQFSISIDDYNEIGTQKWEIFKQHPFSNIVD
ncbi:unnamed protein product [Paramecium octaurelia]|uniref:Actin-related protein 5 n=1 Tax=Paramecium octaurelia TaxID=43137 RepID=A0A8S1T094_PAROT|nr:unnamed protein product [Paramecium octaurelia]